MPTDLYVKIRKNLEKNHVEDAQSVAMFVEELPSDLRKPLSMLVYRDLYKNVDFL